MTMVLQPFCIHNPVLGYFVVADTKYDYDVTSILHTQHCVGLLCCYIYKV